ARGAPPRRGALAPRARGRGLQRRLHRAAAERLRARAAAAAPGRARRDGADDPRRDRRRVAPLAVQRGGAERVPVRCRAAAPAGRERQPRQPAGGLLMARFGAWSTLPTTLAVEALARSGAEFVGLDAQHGAHGFEDLVAAIQLLDALGVESL